MNDKEKKKQLLGNYLEILNLDPKNYSLIYQPEDLKVETCFYVFHVLSTFPFFFENFFESLTVKKISFKLKSKYHSKLSLMSNDDFCCIIFPNDDKIFELENGTKLQVGTLAFQVCEPGVVEFDFFPKKKKFQTVEELSYKRQKNINLEMKFFNEKFDFCLNTELVLKKEEDYFYIVHNEIMNFDCLENFFSIGKCPLTDFFNFLDIKIVPIKVMNLKFKMTGKRILFTNFHIKTKMNINFGGKKYILLEINFQEDYFIFKLKTVEDDVFDSNITFIDGKYTKTSENLIQYCNLNIHKKLFNEEFPHLVKIPKFYHHKKFSISSKIVYYGDYSIKQISDFSMIIYLTKFVQLKISNNYQKFSYNYNGIQFNFSDLDKKGEIVNENYRDFRNQHQLPQFDNSFSFDFRKLLWDFGIWKDVSLKTLIGLDSKVTKDDHIFECHIEIGKIISKLDNGFLEISDKKNEILIRIPLHPRENIEVFVKSIYNSIADECFIKSLDSRKYNIRDIKFSFL